LPISLGSTNERYRFTALGVRQQSSEPSPAA
jgi:hypothetical protein